MMAGSSLEKLLREEGLETDDKESDEQTSSRRTIIVVDDDSRVRNILNRKLSDYNVITAESGEEALRSFNQLMNQGITVFCLVVDAKMPGMNGWQVTKEIHERDKDIPIIMLTAFQDEHTITEAVNHRLEGYVVKGQASVGQSGEVTFPTIDELILKLNVACSRYGEILSGRHYQAEIERLNQELKGYATTLEQRVEQRTAQLVAEANLGLLGRLSAQVAHELRTPQDATRNELELIKDYLPNLVFLHQDVEKLGLEEPVQTEFYELVRQTFEQAGEVEYRTRSTIEALAQNLCEDLKAKYSNITIAACKDIVAMGYETDTSGLDKFLQISNPGEVTSILRKVFNAGYSINNALGAVTKEMSITGALLEHAHGDTKQIEAVSVKEKLSTTLTLYDRAMKDAGIRLEIYYDENLDNVECNVVRLNLAYRNVIQNAIDALKKKEGERILRVKTESENGYAVVEISDNGPGIPPEDINKLAHPTFTTKPIGEGTGLGLSIVHNILQEHNGYLQCSSQPGETTFRLKIPFKYQGKP